VNRIPCKHNLLIDSTQGLSLPVVWYENVNNSGDWIIANVPKYLPTVLNSDFI